MALVRWSKFLETGNHQIDEEHEVLVKHLNDLHDSVLGDFDSAKCSKIFDDLLAYTEYHFQREEVLMVDANYADYEDHKKLHVTFTEYVAKARAAFLQDGQRPVAETVEYLTDWLIDHIKKIDVDLVAVINFGVTSSAS